MQLSSLNSGIFSEEKVQTKILFETEFSKEILITMTENQEMKAHKTPFPIVVELFEGEVDFFVNDEVFHLTSGDILSLEGDIVHSLLALKNSKVRLTLAKKDSVQRVEKVTEISK